MNEAIKERISALVDGELSEFETRRVLEEINSNPELKDYWTRLQIIKSGFKDQSLGFLSKNISDIFTFLFLNKSTVLLLLLTAGVDVAG